ncbi:MAG: uracil-xanthine permease family protein [Anaeroplasma sp.]
MNKELVLDIEESPSKISQWLLFAIQHVLAMLVACITVPLITGLPIGPTLISAGIGTLIYIFTTKRKSPVFLSSSFAYLAPMSTALTLGVTANVTTVNYSAVILGMAMVGVVYVVIALVIKKVGTSWLNKLLPPVVIGPIIMVIGLSLAVSAVSNVLNGTAGIKNAVGDISWEYTFVSICVALFACFLTGICATSKRKNITLIPFVIGMVGAYIFALLLTIIGNLANIEALKVIDFSVFNRDWSSISSWITTDFMFVNAFNQTAKFTWETVGQVALLFIPVAIVTICEHIGDHKNLGNIINRDLLNDEPGLTRTLIGDGIATAVSGAFCGAANTTYGENVAVIGVSKIASVSVIIVAAIMSIVLGFIAPLTMLLQTVPACITGGVSLVLYGFIASSGVKLLIKEKVDFSVTKNIIVASVILVAGIGGLVLGFGGYAGAYKISISSTAVAMILGIVLNLVLKDHSSELINSGE